MFDKDFWIEIIIAVIGVVLAFLVWKLTHKNKPPKLMWIFCFFSFILAISWINLVANILIDFLNVDKMKKSDFGFFYL